jgi:hypothetical protein
MRIFLTLFLYIFFFKSWCQNIDVNNTYNYELIRNSILNGEVDSDFSLNIRPLKAESFDSLLTNQFKTIYSNRKKSLIIKTLGVDYFLDYNSSHPYNRNNGTMIPNRGYQHIISPGLYFKLGPLSIQLKPEHHFSENKDFNGFWEGHNSYIWMKRYRLWNQLDIPEKFGHIRHNNTTFGQSSIKLNWKNFSLGISNENIWWGPSIRNSIMMSNHARGFRHITFNSNKPFKTAIGNFEWQLITGRLENSGYIPPQSGMVHAGRQLWVPKINQMGERDDWRYLQAYIISYSPKWIDGLSIGFIRWVQMYSSLIEGDYTWLNGKTSYFPVFENLFRKKDKYVDIEGQSNEAAGLFLKWLWLDSKADFYVEFHFNDAKQNFRDLLLDTDHSRAATFGINKIFNIKNNDILFTWEWTQMEQNATRLLRNSGSWYEHGMVYDGYTNRGEVLGSSIGPGSNSHYISLSRLRRNEKIGIGFEIIDQDNDFFHEAFDSADDYRRYWKDFNFHLNFNKKFKNFSISSNLVFIRSLNYQWELDDTKLPYYHPGKDVNNLHLNIKLTYFGNW